MGEITTMISNVGFPIFACIYLVKNNEKLITSIGELSSTLKLIDSRIEQLENNYKGVSK